MLNKIKEPVSALTHMIWAILAIPCTILLVILSNRNASMYHVISFAIFGISLILLYTASTLYHMLPVSKKTQALLKKVDHMMIYVLIAGTYTPLCIIAIQGVWGISLLYLIWGMAIIGIVLKLLWHNMPRIFSTLLYIIMGWLAIIAFAPLSNALPLGGMIMLVTGGVVYTLGGIIYAFKWPNFNYKLFGFHELFHIFVMVGSVFHVLLMFKYILHL